MRYVTRPKKRAGYWDEGTEDFILMPETCMVHEDEKEPEPTGVLDANGNELFRVPEKHKMGFKP